MTWKRFRWKLRYYAQYFPFTINTVLCVAALLLVYRLLYRVPHLKEDPDAATASFLPLILLMAKLAFWFFIALAFLSVISAVASRLYLFWLSRNGRDVFSIKFEHDRRRHRLYLHALLQSIRRPLLGFVKGRLIYEDAQLTDSFSLASNHKRANRTESRGITGSSHLQMPDIKEYSLHGAFLYFEDMLRIVSFASHQRLQAHFSMPPLALKEEYEAAHPRKTETNDVRSEELHRTEGDYLNYKDFEAGDDVRRIVWKVYARNRELVVRMPELYEPYVSHVYFYASFYASLKQALIGNGYASEMLNYYKNTVWTIHQALAEKEYEIRYVPDLEIQSAEDLKGAGRTSHIITASNWHQQKQLSQYFNPRQGAVLCFSSFTDPDDLRETLQHCGPGTVVYFVKCSSVFRHVIAWNWIKRLILLPPIDRLGKLRTSWTFSPLRIQIQKREKELEAILKQSNVIHGEL